MKIAIVRLSALGDIVQSMIVLQFIKKKYPESDVDWIVDSKYKALLEDTKYLNKVIPISLSKAKEKKSLVLLGKLLWSIRKLDKYDIVIDLQGLIKSAIITKILKADRKCGFDRSSLKESLSSIFYTERFNIPYQLNVIRRYSELVNEVLRIDIRNSDIVNKESFFNHNSNFRARKKPLIGLVIGTSFHSKTYSVKNYAEIANNFDASFVAIWGSSEEKIDAELLLKLTNKVTLSEKLSFKALKNLICSFDLVIGGDTGPVHLAWACNIPSITIFGPTSKDRNTFITKKNITISSNEEINIHSINKDTSEINTISPSSILKLMHKVLEI